MNDPVDDFLQHPPQLPMNDAFQQALLERTSASVPPRRARRWPQAVAAAAAIAAVIAISAYYWFQSDNVDLDPPKKNFVERPLEKPAPKEEMPAPMPTPTQPRDLEWTAFDAEDDQVRVKLYFQAGDLYLTAHDDIDSALRCYRQALHYCDIQKVEFDPNDNWLVMALKRDYRKER